MSGSLHFLGAFIIGGAVFSLAMLIVSRMPEAAFVASSRSGTTATSGPGSAAQSGEAAELRRQLFQAGFTHPDAPRYFIIAKIILALLSMLLMGIILSLPWPLAGLDRKQQSIALLFAAVPGYFLPTMTVDRLRRAWKRRISIALPDALDFMLVCVEAGQTTDLALLRVAHELEPVHPDLSARLHALTEALIAGAERQDAWNRLAQETENDDIRQLATIIVQSGTMGTPVAQTLRVFSADLRDRRIRQVEERANVLPTKMTLGTMMFTVPPLLILLLAPAIYRLITAN